MIVLKKGGPPRAVRPIDLGRGVVLHARPLDAFAHARVLAAVEADLDAIAADEETRADWGFGAEERAAIAADLSVRVIMRGWMRAALIAAETVDRVEGVETEDGAAAPSLDLFCALFTDAHFDARWRLAMVELDQVWVDEKNVSGRGPSGSGAESSPTIATDAAPSTLPALPAAPSGTAAPGPSAPLTPTPPEPTPAPPPGPPPPPLDSGAAPVSAAVSPA